MALADIRREVVISLAQTHEAQRDARAAVRCGADSERVIAAGELDFLARQEALLRNHLEGIDRLGADRRTMFGWARQAWFGIMLNFESWIAHG